MKKLIALMLAGVLCATAAYTAIAAEDETEEVPAEVVETEESQVADLVEALEGDTQAQEIADRISEGLKSGAASEDINAMLFALADYINGKGYDVADVKKKEGAKKIMGEFLEDCGVDAEALSQAFQQTGDVLDSVLGTGDAADTSSYGSYSSADTGSYDTESYAVYGVESTTIPDTGYIG